MDKEAVEQLGGRLTTTGESLAVAESATGGLLTTLLTTSTHANEFLRYGVAAYSYTSKQRVLSVSRETLDRHGAVSREVAGEMAMGIRDRSGATWGLATTGIAGPGGGTQDKPVGTLYVGVAYAGDWGSEESYVDVERLEFSGGRNELRRRFVDAAVRTLLNTVTSV